MARAALIGAGCLLLAAGSGALAEEGVRYYEENGVTYRETRRIERRPVTATEWEERQRTVYRERYVTETRDAQRFIYTPITEYQAQPRIHNWWNPFGRPYIAYHMKPVTRWETRVQTYQLPHTYREVVPETEVVQVPRQTRQFVEREIVERVALEPSRPTRQMSARPVTPSIRTAERFGGVRRIENDPPRRGLVPLDLSQPVRR